MTISKTKKSFMLAGGIIGIIVACLSVISGFVLLALKSIDIYDLVIEIINSTGGDASLYSAQELRTIISICQAAYGVLGIFAIGIGIGMLICSIVVIKNSTKGVPAKAATIALLVLSVFSCNVISFAFMIVVLCLKDNPNKVEVE